MTNLATKAAIGAVLAVTTFVAAAPADAQRYRHHYRDRDRTGDVIVAGIAGIAIGAALSSDRRYDYDRRYYRERGYYPRDGYWYRQNYRRYRGYNHCTARRVWDEYEGRYVRVRYCR